MWRWMNLSHAHFQISKISNYLTNTSLADWKSECNFLTCNASIVGNEGISMPQHFKTNNSTKTSARQNMELCFPFFRSCHSLHPAINSASIEHSTSINIAKTVVDVCHWLFLGSKEFYQSTLFVLYIIHGLHCEALLEWCYLSVSSQLCT